MFFSQLYKVNIMAADVQVTQGFGASERIMITFLYQNIPLHINSLRPSDAYMRQWTNHHWFRYWLVAWTAPSHYLKQCWIIVNWSLRNKLQWNFNRNSNIFIQENALEHVVCEMASILSRPQCVNGLIVSALCCSWFVLLILTELFCSVSLFPKYAFHLILLITQQPLMSCDFYKTLCGFIHHV